MNNKSIIPFIILLLLLPMVLAQVKIQLGSPYVNIDDISKIKFTAHQDYYEFCSGDEIIIPVLIKNKNEFSDTFQFEVDKEYASLPVKTTALKSGKSGILPLRISPPVDLEENTTVMLDIITKKEGLKRTVVLKTNIKNCYLFKLELDKDKDELCGCDKEIYTLILQNRGQSADTFTLNLDMPGWVNSTLTNNTIKLADGQKKEIQLDVSPSCEERGIFNINAEAVSEKTKFTKEDGLELTILPKKECYNTLISANDVRIDYFGKNIPIIIYNKGAKDAAYALSVEGIDWYTLSQTDFTLQKDQKKTINLALSPGEGVVEGTYNVDIIAKANGEGFTKSITINLEGKSVVLEKIKFYLNYFRYYVGLTVVLFVILSLWVIFLKGKVRKGKKIKEKQESKLSQAELEKQKIKDVPTSESKDSGEIERKEEKKVAKKVKKPRKRIKWLYVVYLISLILLILIIYSTFKYRSYYGEALNFISGLFTTYIIPYVSYLGYLILGIAVLIIIILIINFFRKKPKKKKLIVPNSSGEARTKEEKKKIEKEKQKEEKIETKKISKKITEKRKLRFFEYAYLVLVILLFLGIIGYVIYNISDKQIPTDKLPDKIPIDKLLGKLPIDKFSLAGDFIKDYALYFIIGIVILSVLIIFLRKGKKKILKEKKAAEKAKKKKKLNKKFIKNLIITIVGLVVLSGIIYSFIYYDVTSYIKDFWIVYYPYVLMGVGILAMLILILHFHNKKIS